jgi:hypothetical protein
VERLDERDDFIFVGAVAIECDAAGELEGGFVRFGARVREECAVGEGQRFEAFREAQDRFVRVAVADVPELAALFVEHLQQFRMAVAQRRDRDAACEIHVLAAGRVPHARALCTVRHERRGENTGTITSSNVWRVTVEVVMVVPFGFVRGFNRFKFR